MLPVLLVIHLIACIALVLMVLLQKSEGGALGMGGGGAGAGLISGRGVANVMVRVTMGLAAVFFITSLALTRLNTEESRRPSALEQDLGNQSTDVFQAPSADAPIVEETSEAVPATPAVVDPLAQTPDLANTPPSAATDSDDPVSPTD